MLIVHLKNNLQTMENILENTYYESDTSFTAPLTPTTPNADTIKSEQLFGAQLGDSDGDDDQDSEYQEAAQAIENNLLKDIGTSSDTESTTTIGLTKIKDEFTSNKERKPSISFGDDIIFPGAGIRRNSEQERDRQKRKELRSKRELEEEEREKMQ